MAERQQGSTAAVGQEAEEADAHKAVRKHMEKKAAQKLLGSYGHQFLLAAMRVVLSPASDLTIGECNEPMIGNGNAMGVAGQVMKNVLRSAEGRFGVHDPVLSEEGSKKATEGRLLRERLETAWKGQLPVPKRFL